ncbi:hypothetical protein GQ53DRAFT_439106 [Thozetella sp. PMI_491]|nr:hypothetical protein GQ53DRAFT_439106 [Thozetella sp. PMI_491]
MSPCSRVAMNSILPRPWGGTAGPPKRVELYSSSFQNRASKTRELQEVLGEPRRFVALSGQSLVVLWGGRAGWLIYSILRCARWILSSHNRVLGPVALGTLQDVASKQPSLWQEGNVTLECATIVFLSTGVEKTRGRGQYTRPSITGP